MVKIIMDSGKEYECDVTTQKIQDDCYKTDKITNPMGSIFNVTKFDAKFLRVSDNIVIRTDHISSIEE